MRSSSTPRRTLCGALVVATLAGTALAAPVGVSDAIRWTNGMTDQVTQMPKAQLSQTISQLSARVNASRVLVSLDRPLTANERAELEAQGLTLLSSLGSTHHFASLSTDANAAALSESAIISVTPVQNYQKLHTDLLTGLIRPWTVSDHGAIAKTPLAQRAKNESLLVEEFTQAGIDPTIAVTVMFHKDANYNTESQRLAKQLGARVASQIYSVNAVILHMPASQIDALASDDAVMWAEPPLPPMGELNAENRALTGVNTLQTAPYDLDGSGVTALIYDAGKMANHADIDGRMTVGVSDTDGISDHATHVGGTVGGDGTASGGNHRGMAPAVDLISYAFEQEGGLQEGFLYTDPGDIEADYTEAINLYGVDLSNNSIGTNTAPNGYPCEWQGNYGITSALIDSIVAGSLGNPFRIVWANGNERQSFRCGGDDFGNHGEFYSTAPPACAKNHIAVGSVDADTDLTSSFTSWGPTDDGRIKPDISGPGCQAGGDGAVTSISSFNFTGYSGKCGTSMAAPTVTGISALILQQYRETFPDRDDLRNGTLKALLANTADDSGNPGPDYRYGYGSVRAVPAIDTVIAENIVESELAQGGTYQGVIIVDPGETELRVTIAWDDAPATPNAATALVNDLDLRLIGSDGTIYMPWTLDPNNPNANATQSTVDRLNNIEQVSIMSPPPGAYTVEVTAFNIAQGPTQSFGVVSSSTLINCSSAGIVSVGGNLFSCEGSTNVQVVDCDLNTSDLVVDTVDVMIASDSDAGFMMTLTETAPESATFTASFSYSDSGSADLLVGEGDTVTASYIDADNGEGGTNLLVESSATIDCTPPVISNAMASNIEPRGATLNADFNEPSKVTFNYGPNMGSLNDSVSAGALATSHAVSIGGLTDESSYVFTVMAEDAAGNMSMDDNGGLGYAFTTPDIPDFFTEQFQSGLDLEGMSLTLTPSAAVDGYTATIEPLEGGVLPFEPTDGTQSGASFNDDTHTQYSISDGHSIKIYDESFTSFWISPNGYITNTSNTDYTESFEDHFSNPRISALFDDLNPSSSGNVYTQQLADRVVISWDEVTEYFESNDNTFQIELHFDGTIVMSWETIDVDDAVVGISEGNGMDPDFLMSDLSNYPASSGPCDADFNDDGVLDFFDISEFLSAFSRQLPHADMNGDGEFDFFDISGFLTLYAAGCP
ncbi:MAG: S8 family serine peptidase [Phycisphaerales bacterium]|nr:S8 family serine peptidase [Phycisphaerales bacterium]